MVLGLAPTTEPAFRVLVNLHNDFEDVVTLDYEPRFHVTLDYFRPYPLTRAEACAVRQVLESAVLRPPFIDIDLRQLAYQRFTSMNRYETQFAVADFAQVVT